MSFFVSGEFPDHLYLTIRDGTESICVEAREFLEELWSICAPYLDRDFRRQAAFSFPTRFWEIYLVWTLLRNRIEMCQPPHRLRGGSPDFRISSPSTWMEAILATPGDGDNAVPDRRLAEGGGWVPEQEIILRLRNAIDNKAKKYEKYLDSGAVSDGDPFIIAVGVRQIPLGMAESSPPRIVSAVFPIGPNQILIDQGTGEIVEESRQYRPSIDTAVGSPVSTNIFREKAFQGISGVLYAGVDELNRPDEPGPEFVFVHNPLAANPLPEGVFPFGKEYRRVADILQVRAYPSREV